MKRFIFIISAIFLLCSVDVSARSSGGFSSHSSGGSHSSFHSSGSSFHSSGSSFHSSPSRSLSSPSRSLSSRSTSAVTAHTSPSLSSRSTSAITAHTEPSSVLSSRKVAPITAHTSESATATTSRTYSSGGYSPYHSNTNTYYNTNNYHNDAPSWMFWYWIGRSSANNNQTYVQNTVPAVAPSSSGSWDGNGNLTTSSNTAPAKRYDNGTSFNWTPIVALIILAAIVIGIIIYIKRKDARSYS